MICRNVRTGEIREFACEIKSKFWEAVETQSPVASSKEEAPKVSTAKKPRAKK